MKCEICYGVINSKGANLLGKSICPLCVKSMALIDADNIFYDYYKNRIKHIIMDKLVTHLPQQP